MFLFLLGHRKFKKKGGFLHPYWEESNNVVSISLLMQGVQKISIASFSGMIGIA